METYTDESNSELERDKRRTRHNASIDKLECDECGKQARNLKMVITSEGRKSICKECAKGLK